ncbi:MAG: hypothetical protein DWQ44_04825 [Bacteroidetes bacterium]|nr:MAG: hypothetical protein DWQ33_10965 [Bacteroidota bacterium]REK00610.1 MAG: hypothetical protein DWQ39_10640 [Bacteroidota bacterium]REK35268.1 MAG: hypothetical protein DWQ44_04825 [Bacteroidota bacterium]REK48344.1 MAG: hypothetical protein DWQ48_11025 [Bacteroidota bacterium]
MSLRSGNIAFFIILFVFSFFTPAQAQVSMGERSPFAFTVRGGLLSNNGDLATLLRLKTEWDKTWSLNTFYSTHAEAVLGIDLIRLRTTDIVLHLSALGSEPEILAKDQFSEHRVAMSRLGMARATLTFSFNSDGYKMFSMPWHTNHEAILGVTGAYMYATDIVMTDFAKDSLGITQIRAKKPVKSVGLTFGWNWRIASSGWVIGLNGSVMWFADENPLMRFETDEASLYTSGYLTFAPRILQAGIGYHF